MNHHPDRGSDPEFSDCADWNRASYTPDLLAEIGEPLPEAPNDYRAAALAHLQLFFCIDEFISTASDARLAIVSVAVTLGWPSIRGLSAASIAKQLGGSEQALTRSIARFKTMANLDSAGRLGSVRPGHGLNGNGSNGAGPSVRTGAS
jgi:hypothetical protein